MSNLVEHAKREFKALGYKPIEECEDDPNKWIQESVLELLEVFSKQGHSGMSAPFAIGYFEKLAMFKPLAGITGEDSEWNYCDGTYQNNRLSSVFKQQKNGRPYYLDAIVWKSQNGCTFTGKVEDISSRQYIKSFPFTDKTFYIDVIESENETKIKDRNQLKPVFEYYDKYED